MYTSRVARERRLCVCGSVQTEQHVLCDCELTEPCRRNCNIDTSNLSEIFRSDPKAACDLVNISLNIFEH